ncbi:MAG: 4Fe-4S binding protein [Candidatus Hadarchaeum sp.]
MPSGHCPSAEGEKTLDLTVKLADLRLEFPTVLAPGPLSKDGPAIKRAAEHYGIGAIVAKTVYPREEDTPRPCMIALQGGTMINHDWSALSAEQICRQMKIAKEGKKPVIVSILGDIDEEVRMAKLLEEAGADMLELPISNPSLEQLQENIRKIKEAVVIPLGVKIGPNISDIPRYAKGIERAGADYISGINTLGPVLAIDARTGRPLLGSKFGYGYLSGPAIKPVALRCVAEMAKSVRIPVVGGGGISNGKDAIEFLMAGATCVHLHTAAILRGLGVFSKIVEEISETIKALGYNSLEEIRGLSLKLLNEEPLFSRIIPSINHDLCNGCGLCQRACAYAAIKVQGGVARVDETACFGCGLCATLCPVNAINLS